MTTGLAVRCLRSRRCLLIYWRDSFRRRAAFGKWRRCGCVRGAALPSRCGKLARYLCAGQPRATETDDETVEKRRDEERRVGRVIFISDQRVGGCWDGVTPRIKS